MNQTIVSQSKLYTRCIYFQIVKPFYISICMYIDADYSGVKMSRDLNVAGAQLAQLLITHNAPLVLNEFLSTVDLATQITIILNWKYVLLD